MRTAKKKTTKSVRIKKVKAVESGEEKTEKKARCPNAGINFRTLHLSAAELGEIVGCSPQNLGQLVKAGKLNRMSNGQYAVVPAIKEYCDILRGRNEQERDAKSDGAELEYWKTQKVKQQSLEGRTQICEELLATLLQVWNQVGERFQAMTTDQKTKEHIRQIFDSFEDVARSVNLTDIEQENEVEGGDDATEEEQESI